MKNKWIFIGIGTLLIIVVGIIIFIHFTAPEILTKTPLELITGRDIQNGTKDTVSAPTKPVGVTDNFIVPDEAWQNASLLYLKDGSPFNGAVGFSEIPVGTRLYAPISGYVRYFSTTPDESGRVASEVYLVQDASWDPLSPSPDIRVMVFAAQKLEITNYEPKKGEHFAIITDNTELIDHLYKWRDGQIRMAVIVNEAWGISDRAITDPRDYLRVNIQN